MRSFFTSYRINRHTTHFGGFNCIISSALCSDTTFKLTPTHAIKDFQFTIFLDDIASLIFLLSIILRITTLCCHHGIAHLLPTRFRFVG